MKARRTVSRLRRAGPWPWTVPVLLLALVPLASNIGGASIPDSSDVIHTCYDRDGKLRVIDTAAVAGVCQALEKPLSWNQLGPKMYVNSATVAGQHAQATISCDSGDAVTGGGGAHTGGSGPTAMTNSAPVGGPPPTDWFVRYIGGDNSTEITVYVVCADLAP
jgi:hypothetical protein